MRTKLVLAIACLAAQQASAGTIAIQISHRAELGEGELRAAVSVVNTGDEAAHGVTPILRFRGAEARADTEESLPPEQPLEVSLAAPSGAVAEGRWPYHVVVDYADANLYPFQAVSVATLVVGSPPLPKLSLAEPAGVALADEAELSIRLKNLSETPQRVELRLVAPEAVEVRQPAGSTELGAWEEREIGVGLINRAALPGSRYPVYVTAEWEDGGVHQTLVAQTSVEIHAVDPDAGRGGRLVWIGAAAFGLLLAGLLLLRLRRMRKSR